MQPAGLETGRLAGLSVADVDRIERRVAMSGHHLRPKQMSVRADGRLRSAVLRLEHGWDFGLEQMAMTRRVNDVEPSAEELEAFLVSLGCRQRPGVGR